MKKFKHLFDTKADYKKFKKAAKIINKIKENEPNLIFLDNYGNMSFVEDLEVRWEQGEIGFSEGNCFSCILGGSFNPDNGLFGVDEEVEGMFKDYKIFRSNPTTLEEIL